MKKRIVLVVLALAMLATLAACGAKETKEEGPGVTLGQYKGIEVTKLVLTVSDEDVEKRVYYNLRSLAAATERTEAKLYDTANIDYTGYRENGEKFSGGEAKGTDLMLGSGTFIPGFEEAIVGHSVGEEFDINVTFPENYGEPTLAGKPVVFKIKLNSLKAIPELTDEIIAANSAYKTVEEYFKNTRTTLEKEVETTIQQKFENDVLDKVLEGCTFTDTLQAEADEYEKNLRTQYEGYAKQYGIDLETFLYYFMGVTLDTFNKQLPEAALYNVKLERIYKAVVIEEKIEITDAEYKEYVEDIMVQQSIESAAKVEETYGKDKIVEIMKIEKAEKLIFDSAIGK